jgi:hypothetical protein
MLVGTPPTARIADSTRTLSESLQMHTPALTSGWRHGRAFAVEIPMRRVDPPQPVVSIDSSSDRADHR